MKALVVVLIAAAWTSQLTAQDSTRAAADSAVAPQTHLYRSPRRALILGSLIPGAGHIYAGEYWHGVVNYETTVAGIGGGLLTFMIDRCSFNLDPECDPGPQCPHRVLGVTMVGLGFGGGYRVRVTHRVPRSARMKGTVAKWQKPSRSSRPLLGCTATGARALRSPGRIPPHT
jgi:hypothetical protein